MVNAIILACNSTLTALKDDERALRLRVTEMTDEQLDAMIDEEIQERIRSRRELAELLGDERVDS